ncbi:3-hydroxyisobutyrate dehydrogenase/glyoxylate/succinic semialdehyde reductase [Christiangramia gaetbulicola]|uniref:3-hydroxyisobutyrate dehydrogenase/glyoxylate/succinic semialdehyde reductase n=1 Tax=Christiangramia gaetbulicola TaxID=703340 RepID=A0A2T6AH03_9FLAO|nr:NAD(P)-dependent oxidoreductase [Christiangramia gaetbulicola]PTX43113.1 3-hydroxyisobutyrate dehydrogenase/glyoxylate/succinic semialdehyde reductase [Christiangramia gaetbulicola]
MKIGFIGLGIMGSRMAANLLKAGHSLKIYNRTKAKAEELIHEGADWCESPKAAGEGVDVMFTMLEKPDVVESLATGSDGFLAGLKKGSLWIDSSTVNPSFSERMSRLASESGIRFMDAPVSGSKVPAQEGELLFLCGGTKEDFEEAKPLFMEMGKDAVHIGEAGKGSAMKIMINQLLGQSILAFSESLNLGMAMGIDKKTGMDILLKTPVTAPILDVFRSRIENNEYEANFPLKHLQKDLHLFTETAFELGQPSPLTSAAKEVYGMAKHKNMADLDFTAVFKYLHEKE